MTKDDIKKALECCSNPNTGSCKDCPYNYNDEFHCAYGEMCKDALNLINEQETEIERLKAENETYCKQINQAYDTGYNDGYDSCQDDIKRAKIDVLNEVKERAIGLAAIETYYICNLVDELIKEVQNAEDKG